MLSVLLAACDGGQNPIPPGKLGSAVLQPADVGQGFFQFDVGRQELLDFHLGPRRDPRRFERVEGWKARYRPREVEARTGPLVIESRVDLFREEEGAKRDLDAYTQEFQDDIRDAPRRGRSISVPTIGNGAVAITFTQGRGARTVRYYRVAWRFQTLTGFIGISGFEGTISVRDAIRFAQKQQEHMVALSGA